MTQPKIGTRFTHPDWPTGLTLKSIHSLGHLVLETPAGEEVVSNQDPRLQPVVQTPAEAEVEKILSRFFPGETFDPNAEPWLNGSEDQAEALAIYNAVSAAFAAGRDFEGRRRDKRAERDAKADAKACAR